MTFSRKLNIGCYSFDKFILKEFTERVKKNNNLDIFEFDSIHDFQERHFPDVVLYFVDGASVKNLKLVKDFLFQFNHLNVILILSRPEAQSIIEYFRLGVFDIWTYPMDEVEITRSLNRLQAKGNHLEHFALKMALHLFSQADIYEDYDEILEAWKKYIRLFSKRFRISAIKNKADFSEVLSRYEKSEANTKKLESFLKNNKNVFFGLSLKNNVFRFLLRLSKQHLYLFEVEFKDRLNLKASLATYNVLLLQATRDYLFKIKKQKKLEKLVLTDEITGLYNQRKLSIDIEHAIKSYEQNSVPFSLLFIDIDFFKKVNDQYGHVIGSQLLIDMAQVLHLELRGADAIYRFGGDEFIVLLDQTKIEEAKKIARRLSESVKGKEFRIGRDKTYQLSLSIGIAEFPTDAKTSKEIIDFADKMMYLSKKSGRGKVFHVNEVI